MHSASFGLSVVVANWVVTLLERNDDASAEARRGRSRADAPARDRDAAGGRARVRPAGLLRGELPRGRGRDGAARARLALRRRARSPPPSSGSRPGCRSQSAFTDAARLRPDAPGGGDRPREHGRRGDDPRRHAALGLSFSLPGDGRLGFAVVAVLWALAALCVPRTAPAGSRNGGISDPECLISCVEDARFRSRIWIQRARSGWIRRDWTDKRGEHDGTGTRAVDRTSTVHRRRRTRDREPRHVKVTGNVAPPSATSRARTSGARSGADGVASSCGRAACPNCGFGGTNVTTMQLVGGTETHARCTCGHTWTPGQKPVYVVTRAETAECTCPDDCERDHANE